MVIRLNETVRRPQFTPVGDQRAEYETYGTSFLQYLARRAAKSSILLPLRELLAVRRGGGPEYAAALACFAYYAVAASTTYGKGYRQPAFTVERRIEERDRQTGAVITVRNMGEERTIAAEVDLALPGIGQFRGSERILGTTVGLRGLGMAAPSTFTFAIDESGHRAGLAAWWGEGRGTITTELAPSLRGTTIRAYGELSLTGSDGSRGRTILNREGHLEVEVTGPTGDLYRLNAPLK
jgi:hypothetical protein